MAMPWEFWAAGGAFAAFGILFFLVFLALAVLFVALAVMVVVDAYRRGRTGWWIYLICMFVSPLSLIAIIAWYAHFRNNPTRLGEGITI